MGKGIIIYQSKYGATRKYAEWLKEATGFDLAETKKADADMLSGCDTVRRDIRIGNSRNLISQKE